MITSPTSRRALRWSLLGATLLAAALRLYRLDQVPISLYCDEAFSGYEAYSLLQTGRDSRGVALPLFFDIFGKGWGEPLYIYLSVPSIGLLGLTPFATRLVAAIAGTLAVPATGLMVSALLWRETPHAGRGSPRDGALAAALAAALMAISPWAFHFSRIAFQASLLPVVLAGGFWLAASALRDDVKVRPALLVAGAALLGLSLYTYTVARLAMPLLVAGFAWLYRHRLRRSPAAAAAAAATLLLLAAPIVGFSMTARGTQRLSDVSIMNRADVAEGGPLRAAMAVAGNYLSYHSPRFLLTDGDPNPRHSVDGHGMLHPHDLLLLGLGALGCLLAPSRGRAFLLWWLLAYPVAAALTIDARHAVRALCGLPGLYAVAGLGAQSVWRARRPPGEGPARRWAGPALLGLMLAAVGLSTWDYFRLYFGPYRVQSAPAWQYGLKETYATVESMMPGHDSVYITRNEDFPHSQLIFYRRFPPREYQAHGLSGTPYLFDQEVFYKGPRIPNRLNPIFVWKPYEVPEGVQVRHAVKYPDGTDAFLIAW